MDFAILFLANLSRADVLTRDTASLIPVRSWCDIAFRWALTVSFLMVKVLLDILQLFLESLQQLGITVVKEFAILIFFLQGLELDGVWA